MADPGEHDRFRLPGSAHAAPRGTEDKERLRSMGLLKALFGDYSAKEVKKIRPLCDKVLALE